jgi:sulfate permease
MVLSYTLIQLLIEHNFYPIVAMAGVLISVFGVLSLMKKTHQAVTEVAEK